MERCTTRAEFCQAIEDIAECFAEELWTTVVETGSAGADAWVRTHGGAWLRQALGVALRVRAERLGVSETCACGGAVTFRQHRPTRVHTVLPGRDVEATVLYGQCGACQRGLRPVLGEIGVDEEGFTPALQALATLAAVVEPYEPASTELLGRMAGVGVSTEKMQALVRDEGARATRRLTTAPTAHDPARPSAGGPLTVGIDGGMIFVDKHGQEVKLACLYDTADRVVTPTRGMLTRRDVVAVRGTPEALAAQLWPRAEALGAADRRVVVLGDGAPWIGNLAEVLVPHRVEILDWYHADAHISAVARLLYGDGTEKAAAWRTTQLDRLATDGVDQVIEGLRFLGAHQRAQGKRKAVHDLHRYLTTNRDRMRYETFRTAGYAIGSGAVESAVSPVVQQRMKRVGMRWRSAIRPRVSYEFRGVFMRDSTLLVTLASTRVSSQLHSPRNQADMPSRQSADGSRDSASRTKGDRGTPPFSYRLSPSGMSRVPGYRSFPLGSSDVRVVASTGGAEGTLRSTKKCTQTRT